MKREKGIKAHSHVASSFELILGFAGQHFILSLTYQSALGN
jgi:hypothetical protein